MSKKKRHGWNTRDYGPSFAMGNAILGLSYAGKTISRCTSLRVLPVPGTLVLSKKTRDHLDNPPMRGNHLPFPLNEPTSAPTGKTSRQLASSVGPHRAHYTLFLFSDFFSLILLVLLLPFFFFFFTVVFSCPAAWIRRAQRWFSWPTGTDWRCEPHSSRPRATSQWPTEDLDRARPSPLSSFLLHTTTLGPNGPTIDDATPTTCGSIIPFFFRARSSLFSFLSSRRLYVKHRWKISMRRNVSSWCHRDVKQIFRVKISCENDYE